MYGWRLAASKESHGARLIIPLPVDYCNVKAVCCMLYVETANRDEAVHQAKRPVYRAKL